MYPKSRWIALALGLLIGAGLGKQYTPSIRTQRQTNPQISNPPVVVHTQPASNVALAPIASLAELKALYPPGMRNLGEARISNALANADPEHLSQLFAECLRLSTGEDPAIHCILKSIMKVATASGDFHIAQQFLRESQRTAVGGALLAIFSQNLAHNAQLASTLHSITPTALQAAVADAVLAYLPLSSNPADSLSTILALREEAGLPHDSQIEAKLITAIAKRAMLSNVADTLEWLASLPSGLRESATQAALINLAGVEPLQALRALETLNPAGQYPGLTVTLASALGQSDMQQCLEWIKTRDVAEQPLLLHAALAQLATRDPEAAIGAIVSTSILNTGAQTPQLTKLITNAFSTLAERDIDTAVSKLVGTPLEKAQHPSAFVADAIIGISMANPSAALKLLGTDTISDLVPSWSTLQNKICSQWADKDPLSARAWAQANLGGSELNTILDRCTLQLAATQPHILATLVQTSDFKVTDATIYPNVATALGNLNISTALQWATSIPQEHRPLALAALVETAVRIDPTQIAAVTSAIIQCQTEPHSESPNIHMQTSIATLAHYLIEGTPRDALDWANKLPEQLQTSAYSSIAQIWCTADPLTAADWIANMPNGLNRDTAIKELVPNLADDPESAFAWAASIDDDISRIESLQAAVNQWYAKDPGSSQRAILGSALPHALQQQLLANAAAETQQ